MGKRNPELRGKIAELHGFGASSSEIAAQIGVTVQTVNNHLRAMRGEKLTACPACGRRDLPSQSVYCYRCGAPILTEGQRAAKALKEAFSGAYGALSSTCKDQLRDAVNAAALLLEKK